MKIREIRVEDAEDYLDLCKSLDEETKFMLFEPGERQLTVSEQESKLQEIIDTPQSMIFVAEEETLLIGFIAILGNDLIRTLHRAALVIGIQKEYQNRGIGKQLMARAEEWARSEGIHRLELTVMSQNKQALWLYSAFDFNVEGIRRKALFVDGQYVDEFYMSKFIDQ